MKHIHKQLTMYNVLKTLKMLGGTAELGEIAAALGIDSRLRSQLSSLVAHMCDRGYVERVRIGLYRITQLGVDFVELEDAFDLVKKEVMATLTKVRNENPSPYIEYATKSMLSMLATRLDKRDVKYFRTSLNIKTKALPA